MLNVPRWDWLERTVLDLRYAVRLWTRNPGFSTIAILTVAIGIGASTAIVGQISAVFWTPLPVSRPTELRLLAWTAPRHPYVGGPNVVAGPPANGTDTFGSFSYPVYEAIRDGSRVFTDLACWADLGEARPVVLGELGFASMQFVSGNYFRMLGIDPAVGRTIQPDDDRPGAYAPVAMVSHRFWQRTFGGDRNVTKQSLSLNGHTFAVVGVMPDGFFGLDPSASPDVVVPVNALQIAAATTNPLQNRFLWNVCRLAGRLAPGVSDEEARVAIEQWVRHAIAAAPPPEPYDVPRIWLIDASRGLPTLRDATIAPLTVLLAVVGGLLLAACANIAGLLLARGSAREREIATRLALGAARGRIVGQLVTESLVLSLAGGLVGLAFAYALARPAVNLLSGFMPTLFGADRALTVSTAPDAYVAAFGIVMAVVAGLLFGVSPAFCATRVDLMRIIKQTTTTGSGPGKLAGSHAMVATQTALAILLLVGAGLFLRTVSNLRAADLGFKAEGLMYARVEPRAGRLPTEQRLRFFEDAAKRLAVIPGVTSASAAAFASLSGASEVSSAAEMIAVCTRDMVARGASPSTAAHNRVLPGYFATMGLPLVAGRDLNWADNAPGPVNIVVNEAFATQYFPGTDALGQGVGLNCPAAPAQLTIVGIVGNSKHDLRSTAGPTFYLPLRSNGGPVTLIVRTSGDAAAMIPTVRRAVTELNAKIPTFSEATFVEVRERQLRRERLLSDLLALFSLVTLFVCCLGIYGMLSYSVARRRAEISLRIAIGARAAEVTRMIVGESLVPVGAGIAVGCGAAVALARWIESLLFGVSGHDPLTIAGAAVVFLLVAAAAAAIPARAAARVDPVLALRQ